CNLKVGRRSSDMAFSTQDRVEVLSKINVTPLVEVMLVVFTVFHFAADRLHPDQPAEDRSSDPGGPKGPAGGEHQARRHHLPVITARGIVSRGRSYQAGELPLFIRHERRTC